MQRLTVKTAKEFIEILDKTHKTTFKDRKCQYPFTEWEHKREKIKDRLHNLPKYIHRAVQILNLEEQKMGRPQK
ncbi:MAG: hypothetical protein LBQ98_03740 [Nitrososphaerota archaeon]|jgi:endonuclease I|nr:hypothetical protein [Nitrososphaerota archaeon]